jgi:ABC-type bacteriocin/lantibiotic exporter with double-glycine peptidase domain
LRAASALLALLFTLPGGMLRGEVRLDVPFVRQEKNGCGSAAISMLLGYWQQHGARVPAEAADARAIQRALYSSEAAGIYASSLARYLERQGFRTFTIRAAWEDLGAHLAKGRPLIVSLGHSRLHYVVVAGIDDARGLVLVNDPAQRKLMKLDRASFERDWYERWTLLAVPRATE